MFTFFQVSLFIFSHIFDRCPHIHSMRNSMTMRSCAIVRGALYIIYTHGPELGFYFRTRHHRNGTRHRPLKPYGMSRTRPQASGSWEAPCPPSRSSSCASGSGWTDSSTAKTVRQPSCRKCVLTSSRSARLRTPHVSEASGSAEWPGASPGSPKRAPALRRETAPGAAAPGARSPRW